ncbi:taste receptor type 1 member 3 [Platysternon megacephalum]|uniref:Taste receptor type 1 member 3 n=1 Tax=Platysternon megacephalum TaxID=55544 RepID=A0A4D9F3G3_9SAUR|nr:taste receptor type 1 member 3 [Platysternon megacephalum]
MDELGETLETGAESSRMQLGLCFPCKLQVAHCRELAISPEKFDTFHVAEFAASFAKLGFLCRVPKLLPSVARGHGTGFEREAGRATTLIRASALNLLPTRHRSARDPFLPWDDSPCRPAWRTTGMTRSAKITDNKMFERGIPYKCFLHHTVQQPERGACTSPGRDQAPDWELRFQPVITQLEMPRAASAPGGPKA